ncbi:MAG: DUF4102 domain-containing protein, partial [Rhodobacteraceae bacterium]|nr:DUF4102 domain-containing protein [Paracoccaceae bacterium]
MPKLTKRFVEGLEIKETDYIVFDTDVGGFAVRVFPSGRKSYMIQYRSGGRTRRLAIGKHGTIATDEARKEALRRLGEVAKELTANLGDGIIFRWRIMDVIHASNISRKGKIRHDRDYSYTPHT